MDARRPEERQVTAFGAAEAFDAAECERTEG
jgi:hypothetical protein